MLRYHDQLTFLIDDARAGRLSRRDVFVRGLGLGLTTAASLALTRAVPAAPRAPETPRDLTDRQRVTYLFDDGSR